MQKIQFEAALKENLRTLRPLQLANLNPQLEIQGILLTMYDRRNKLSSQVEEEARNYFKEKVYQTVIPRNVDYLKRHLMGYQC